MHKGRDGVRNQSKMTRGRELKRVESRVSESEKLRVREELKFSLIRYYFNSLIFTFYKMLLKTVAVLSSIWFFTQTRYFRPIVFNKYFQQTLHYFVKSKFCFMLFPLCNIMLFL